MEAGGEARPGQEERGAAWAGAAGPRPAGPAGSARGQQPLVWLSPATHWRSTCE